MRLLLVLTVTLVPALTVLSQESGTVEVRLFGAEGEDEAKAVWADEQGILLAGETTSDITMAAGQAVWAPGGPAGLKGFVTAFDTALNWSWSYSFVGDVGAPMEAPSALVVRSVVRSAVDSAAAWVLYDAPVAGQWQSNLTCIHPEAGVVAHHVLSAGGAVTFSTLVPAGEGFFWLGNEAPTAVPESNSGLRLGFWEEQGEADPDAEWLVGAEGHMPVAADWHADTLYIATHRPNPEAPSAILLVAMTEGVPTLVGTAPIADPDLLIVDVAAGPQGVAWSGTVLSADGTLDTVFGKLAEEADPADPETWGQSWIQTTVSDSDRPARSVLWSGNVLRCAALTMEGGAGGSGILIQTRTPGGGTWLGQYAFGGEEEEELHDMALDHQGRLILAGSSTSWSELGSGNGSQDAALFRIPFQEIGPGFETVAEQAVLPNAAFVGLPALPSDREDAVTVVVRRGEGLSFPPGCEWFLFDSSGQLLASGKGGQWICEAPCGWHHLFESDGQGHTLRRRLWVAP